MKRRDFLKSTTIATTTLAASSCSMLGATPARKPNIIYILADDLGYGDLGCYGQKIIKTPNLDRMAKQGMRFTDHYAGSTVCAPARCVLMTGLHTGHCRVRGNGAGAAQTLNDGDVTVAEKLKAAGYSTALVGKWGLGDEFPGTTQGIPNRQGFDYFFGYLNQAHAHNYFPEFLWRNTEKVILKNEVKRVEKRPGGFTGGAATKRVDYSHDLFANTALEWIDQNQNHPFFLYLALTIPHANNEGTRMTGDGAEVPDYGIYEKEDWPKQDKGQAAMITRMDKDVGKIIKKLKQLDLDKDTIVMFSSDNGPHNEAGHNLERFQPSGPLRGIKRALYEGGIRVPLIAWWPGKIKRGTTSSLVSGFQDMMPTFCNLVDVPCPPTDGISMLPTLLGETGQKIHDHLYWEFYEQSGKQAVRKGDWKAVRQDLNKDLNAPIELYHLRTDIHEDFNVAEKYPKIVQEMKTIMEKEHLPSPYFKFKGKE